MLLGIKKNQDLKLSPGISLQIISHDTKVNFKMIASRCKSTQAILAMQVSSVDKKGTENIIILFYCEITLWELYEIMDKLDLIL